jgi:hypothetical protein
MRSSDSDEMSEPVFLKKTVSFVEGILFHVCLSVTQRPLHGRGDREAHGVEACVHFGLCPPVRPACEGLGSAMDSPPGRGAKLKECGRLLADGPEVSRRKCSSPEYTLLRRGIECAFFYRKSRGEPGRGAPPDEASCGPIFHPPREAGWFWTLGEGA